MRILKNIDIDPRLVTLAVVAIGFVTLLIIGACSGAFSSGVFGKVLVMIKFNISFWVIIFLSLGFGLFRKITNPERFTWLELPIQFVVSVLVIFLSFHIFFCTATNIMDTEIWNGYVQQVEYYEEWTEEKQEEVCVSRDKNGNCTHYETRTYNVYHPPEWLLITSNKEVVSISRNVYLRYIRKFGNETKVNLVRLGQVSIGDGDMFYTAFKGEPDRLVPSAVEHKYVNYLKASNSIKRRRGSAEKQKNLLRPYPRTYRGNFGGIEIDRVVIAASNVTPEMEKWAKKIDFKLDRILAKWGAAKQANVLVYLVETSDQSFLHALEEYWCFGKKNDVVIILGVTAFPKIDWAAVMSWTEIEEFKINLRDRILAMKNMAGHGNDGFFVKIIEEEISKPLENGGFKRKQMKDLEYLVSDITLPWWSQIIIVFLAGGASWIVSIFLVENEIRRKRR